MDFFEVKVIIVGGCGVKSEEGFKLLKELVDVLGGVVGVFCGVCDVEYCDYLL